MKLQEVRNRMIVAMFEIKLKISDNRIIDWRIDSDFVLINCHPNPYILCLPNCSYGGQCGV